MAMNIDSGAAQRLIKDHNDIIRKTDFFVNAVERLKNEIIESANALKEFEAARILRDVPVEELNRENSGFRAKTLRDAGVENMHDIYRAKAESLAAIDGVSIETAGEMKKVADDYMDRARNNAHTKLSLDDKNPAADKLVRAIAKYGHVTPLTDSLKNTVEPKREVINNAIKNLEPAAKASGMRLMLPSRKVNAENAYNLLQGLLDNVYGERTRSLITSIERESRMTSERAWRDFADNPVRFFNVLENIQPGVVSEEKEKVYGLPEEIAMAVSQEEFSTEGLSCQLRRYQDWGVKYILNRKRVLLGDEMGLGKTVQAIAAMSALNNDGSTHFVVVCPASVLSNWCREVAKHSQMTVIKVHGAGREQAISQWMENGGVAVTTYETTAVWTLPEDYKFTMLTVDEAHYIKNPEAQRTKNVKTLAGHAERLLFMTGTALENRVDEMVALVDILQPEVAEGVKGMEALSGAPRFREIISSAYYRRRREDVLTELPELIDNKEWCELLPDEKEVYEQAVLDNRFSDARRVSWSAPSLEESSKAKRLKELVAEAKDDGRKVIVFSFFLDTIAKVCELFGEECMPPINGSNTPERRQEIIDEFDKAPAGTVLAAQIQSGGTGLNIQSASVVVLCEPQFKPSIENQAISRAYRMGQSRNVLVYRLLAEDSVDEKIMEVLENKQAIFDAFADTSAVADQTAELDAKGYAEIMAEEQERILAERGELPENVETGATEVETVEENEE